MLHLEKLGALGDRHDPAVVVSITTVVEFRFPQLPNSALAPLNHALEPRHRTFIEFKHLKYMDINDRL